MKKTLTVNLGGIVFHIDEDAYRLLDEYLCNLRLYFRKQEGAEEIVNDMENRISELFQEKVDEGTQVINITFVEEIIARMGKPEELAGMEEEAKTNENTSSKYSQSAYTGTMGGQKRLYRNPDDKILGGVMSGLAAYLGWDVTLLRLIAVVLLVGGLGTLVVVYIVCWLIIPEARTAAEKLNMRGQPVTMENIGKTVTDGFEKASRDVNDFINSDKPRNFIQKLADVLVAIVGFLLKACLLVFAVIFAPVVIILLFVVILLIITALVNGLGAGTFLYDLLPLSDWAVVSASPMTAIIACISMVILTVIPLICLLRLILRQFFNWKPMNIGLKWSLLAFWIAGLVVFLISFAELNWQLPNFFI